MDNQEKKLNNENILKDNIEAKKENINDGITLRNKKIDDLKLQLLHNQKKIHDIELRKLANIENLKKNTVDKIKTIKNIEIEAFLQKTIPIIDSLEDVLKSSDELNITDTPLIQGIELTLESLLNILFKLGVTTEGKKDDLFNPEIHTPIFIESSEKKPVNHIISIIKKGLTFKKILLRKAIVTIPKN